VRDLLKADVGLSVTGVAGPEEQDGQPAGTVFVGLSLGRTFNTPRCDCGDRPRVRAYSAISALDVLRRASTLRAKSGFSLSVEITLRR